MQSLRKLIISSLLLEKRFLVESFSNPTIWNHRYFKDVFLIRVITKDLIKLQLVKFSFKVRKNIRFLFFFFLKFL